jgi:NADH-quinone oxidoreductase subunit A
LKGAALTTSINLNLNFWPFVIYFLAVTLLVAVMLGLSYLLGGRHNDPATNEPYESGIVSTGTAHVRYDVKFYQNAIFFVIFDLEAVFLFIWAIVVQEAGWPGYIEILVFIGILMVALVYLLRRGALDWQTLRNNRK